MRIAGETIGARGITVMSIAAIAGVALGVQGWSARAHTVSPGLAGPAPGASASSAGAQPTQSAGGSAPSQGPSAAASPTASAAPTAGPKLGAQSYASYSFQVWPGPVSQTAQAAMTGLSVNVTRHGSGISVSAGVTGQPAQAPVVYPTGTKVWVIEASMGDDSGSDFNLGDDGLVVTDAQGRILQ